MNFKFPDRIPLANLPTPLTKCQRLSEQLGGHELYVKRDDLTGFALGGNKVRKLEFSVAEALAQGADVLITCGGIQSNHARATAVVAAQLGISSVLLLRGEPGQAPDGNLLIDTLVGAEILSVTPEQYYHEIDALFEQTADTLKSKGKHPYFHLFGRKKE